MNELPRIWQLKSDLLCMSRSCLQRSPQPHALHYDYDIVHNNAVRVVTFAVD